MTWPLADSLDGPTLADAPDVDEDWRLFAELEAAAVALAVRLKHEPGLSRAAAELFCKLETNAPGIFFRPSIWPTARRLAGLPLLPRGRPARSALEKSAPK